MIFTIKKGHHYSNQFLYKLVTFFNFKNKRSNIVEFNESALYVDSDKQNDYINKLFGFSNGLHHKNSYRFGWNCLNNKLHIYAYTYINGVLNKQDMGVIEINKEYRFTIRVYDNKCVYTYSDSEYNVRQLIINVPFKKVFGYLLWPYFGGKKTALQKTTIKLTHKF